MRLRLTHKIIAIGVIGVIGVVLIGGIHLYGEKAMAVYRDAADNARTIAELNRRIEVELLEGRRAEKDFLLRNDAKKADSCASMAVLSMAALSGAMMDRPSSNARALRNWSSIFAAPLFMATAAACAWASVTA